jgi:hypothetical protein
MNNIENRAMYQGYFGLIPENRTIPIALFLSEDEAIRYADGTEIKKYPASVLSFEVLRKDRKES